MYKLLDHNFRSILILALLLDLSLPLLTYAALPGSFNYQAFLTDAAGAPVDGTVNIHLGYR